MFKDLLTKHLKNIFESGELVADSVSSILEHTANDGKNYKTTFYNNDTDNDTDKRESKIINLIKNNNQITANQIAKLLDITSRTAQRDLEKLTKSKSIIRKGSAKGGYWEIINE